MRLAGALVFMAASALPLPAFAHGLAPGPIGIYFAAVHALTEMPLPLVLISIGLLLGLNRDAAIGQTWLFLLSGIAGGLAGILAWGFYIHPILPLLSLVVITALWAASGVDLPRSAAATLGVINGYCMGVFLAPGPAPWLMQAYAIVGAIVGATIGVLGTYFVVISILDRWNFFWVRLTLRIMASWIAAIAAMVAALSLR